MDERSHFGEFALKLGILVTIRRYITASVSEQDLKEEALKECVGFAKQFHSLPDFSA
jgi:hypothetical protein